MLQLVGKNAETNIYVYKKDYDMYSRILLDFHIHLKICIYTIWLFVFI